MKTDAKVLSIIRDLNRSECEEILAEYGFQVYSTEETHELREAIEANYKDGTIYGNDIVSTWGPAQ